LPNVVSECFGGISTRFGAKGALKRDCFCIVIYIKMFGGGLPTPRPTKSILITAHKHPLRKSSQFVGFPEAESPYINDNRPRKLGALEPALATSCPLIPLE
jgi:hypothetical protein